MKLSKNIFFNLERKLGTEGAFNILMVANNVRKSFFEALRFRTTRKLNNYMVKYKELISVFKNIDIYIFEIKENKEQDIYTIRFMIFNKKHEKDIKKLKLPLNHKLMGKLLDYSCPHDLKKKFKFSYGVVLIKNIKKIYQHGSFDPNKVYILKQYRTLLFRYGCLTNNPNDYNNIKNIGEKCMTLIKKLDLPYRIEIEMTQKL